MENMLRSRRKDEPLTFYSPTAIQMRSVVKGDHFIKRRKRPSIWVALTFLIGGLWGLVELARAIY